jgi:hypothetical protein
MCIYILDSAVGTDVKIVTYGVVVGSIHWKLLEHLDRLRIPII